MELLGADKALAELNSADPNASKLTIDELSEKWLTWRTTSKHLTPRTQADYRRDLKNWVLPRFGGLPAESIDESDVQGWVDWMSGKLSPKSVADKHMLLNSMYSYARAKSRNLVSHNPCLETELPKRRSRALPKAATAIEYRAILAAALERNPDAADLITFLGETGWRFSEAIALGVRDVEDDGDTVFVTVTRVVRLDGSGMAYIAEDEAKTDAAFRRINLLRESSAVVRRRLIGKAPGDLVFTNSRGIQWNQNTFLRDTWPAYVKAAKLDRKVTPHWLRHMHVAVCVASGMPMAEIQRRIGHEHYSTTVGTYGSGIGNMSAEAVAAADRIMSGAPLPSGLVVPGEIVAELD